MRVGLAFFTVFFFEVFFFEVDFFAVLDDFRDEPLRVRDCANESVEIELTTMATTTRTRIRTTSLVYRE